ncbi:MAG TPA: phosphoribosylaminoimidazolesuccinocarboxamide synthase [Candidatus Bathyarchaeia archaeon]|nr:phosphoribosylaminoimidazolesuccinocarboxamide synthase [Candidatus Bathyarchaeia archaeon]
MTPHAVCETRLPNRMPSQRGKVRDIYDLGETLVIVATDRLSAFDWVNPVGIPDKGKILTAMSLYWFKQTGGIVQNHLISADLDDFPKEFQAAADVFEGRSMLVKKCKMFAVEFVIRGYLAGSGLKEYRQSGTVCGIRLPEGLVEADKLDSPLFTPATKATDGHDINISDEDAAAIIGRDWVDKARIAALAVYLRAREIGEKKGIIICDTKFEFGTREDELVLADEVLTPDSSRFWPADEYRPGRPQPSYDKQFVRDWLETTGWDKNSPPPPLPGDIVEKTRQKYVEAYRKLTGKSDF